MIRSSRGAGFTLVEVIIALLVGIVVLAIAIGLLLFFLRSLRAGEERSDPREAGHLALSILREELSDAVAFQLAAAGDRIGYLGPGGGAGEFTYDPSKGSLVHRSSEQPPRSLFSSGLKSFEIRSMEPGVLSVTLEIASGSTVEPGGARPAVTMRDVLLIPCVFEVASSGDPWRLPRVLIVRE